MTVDQDMPNTVAPEALSRWMARPADEGPFWQRQREAMQGRIEPMEKESMCLRIIKLFRVFSWRKDRLQ